ncbi:hypothetical protein KFK09_011849 [Dendrobium nobile]|uniref:Uncharacterized protein n=1 Tax=Dendrobium nobile TaxID=94219 RepID=A0A8T3BFQ5_DENNO|nr:hypothetical protein KFK09_011849 [Dendrobium nobile]
MMSCTEWWVDYFPLQEKCPLPREFSMELFYQKFQRILLLIIEPDQIFGRFFIKKCT